MKCGIISVFLFFPPLHSFAAAGKRQLLDFRRARAPWLKPYPMMETEIEKVIKEGKEEIKKSAEDFFKEFPRSPLLPYKFYVEELKLFPFHDRDIVSVRMVTYTYTGGAHGGKNYYSWNWSKAKKKFLSLDEAISPEQFAALVRQVRQTLFSKEKQGDEYDKHRKAHIQRGTSSKEDFKIWNFDREGIVFVFPEYQVASYTAGSFEIYTPLKSL